jgi:hypothetical protein
MTETFGQVVQVITFISLLVLVSCTHTVRLSASGLTVGQDGGIESFDEALNKVLGTVLVDLPLFRRLIEDIIECERLVRTDDTDLGLVRNVGYAFRTVVDLLLQCEGSNTKRDLDGGVHGGSKI